MNTIKTWQERLSQKCDEYREDTPEESAMLSEIEELRAAIASQAPRQALSDAEIDAIYVDYTGTPSDRNSMKVARAIEAASGPNAALVAALQSCCDILCDLDMESSNAYNSARAALAAVGVEP